MFNALSKKLEAWLVALSRRVAGRLVIGRVYDAHALARQKLEHVVAREGITSFSLIKVRSDGRCVASGVHPAFGRVAVKSWMAGRNPFKAQANFHLSRLVQQTGEGLFPPVYRAEAGYTLEAWTEGRCLAQMKPHEFRAAPLVALFDGLKAWSLRLATGQKMYREDVEELVLRYVLKKMEQVRYGRKGRMVRRVRNLMTGNAALRSGIEKVQALAPDLELPQCGALMDIGPVNLIQSSADGRIYVIDYEQTMHSHYGFDAAYILHGLSRKRAPGAVTEALERHVFTARYAGSEKAAAFFEAHYRLLNEVGRVLG